jgi:hypothetical protein
VLRDPGDDKPKTTEDVGKGTNSVLDSLLLAAIGGGTGIVANQLMKNRLAAASGGAGAAAGGTGSPVEEPSLRTGVLSDPYAAANVNDIAGGAFQPANANSGVRDLVVPGGPGTTAGGPYDGPYSSDPEVNSALQRAIEQQKVLALADQRKAAAAITHAKPGSPGKPHITPPPFVRPDLSRDQAAVDAAYGQKLSEARRIQLEKEAAYRQAGQQNVDQNLWNQGTVQTGTDVRAGPGTDEPAVGIALKAAAAKARAAALKTGLTRTIEALPK